MVYIANTVLYMKQCMINLNELAIFVEVVDSGNFTSAARRLGLPKSNVSRKIALLESRLETRLLHRNTRSMSLTEAGRRYYEHCSLVVNNAREAEEVISGLQLDLSGTLAYQCTNDGGCLCFASVGESVSLGSSESEY